MNETATFKQLYCWYMWASTPSYWLKYLLNSKLVNALHSTKGFEQLRSEFSIQAQRQIESTGQIVRLYILAAAIAKTEDGREYLERLDIRYEWFPDILAHAERAKPHNTTDRQESTQVWLRKRVSGDR